METKNKNQMLSQTKQRLYMEAANLIGTIRLYRNMLVGANDYQREAISKALMECKAELDAIEQQLNEQYLITKNLN